MAQSPLSLLLTKYRELIPLFTFVGGAGLWALFSSWHAINKSDVVINKTGNPEPWQHVDPTRPQKVMEVLNQENNYYGLVTLNQEWKPIEELEKVRRLLK